MDHNDQDFEEFAPKKSTVLDTEEVKNFKDAVMNPVKQDMENKFSGMKDLFTSILAENRKDYDNQIIEMKTLFTSILDDNRKQFQVQLQDMYKALPALINQADGMRRQEEYVYINNQDGKGQSIQSGKFTKMSAVKELLAGQDQESLHMSFNSLEEEISVAIEADKKSLVETTREIYNRLNLLENRILDAVDALKENVFRELEEKNSYLVDKREVYGITIVASENIRNLIK